MQPKPLKPKRCKVCKELFQPLRSLQQVCGIECSKTHANALRAKKERREYKDANERIKTRQDWIKEAQAAFNQFTRARDSEEPCISCGRHHAGQYHAGHYRTTAAAPELRFNELNVHKQCSACNNHKHGNIVEYRINLIKKIGLEMVEWLEGPHEPKKYTIEELKEIKAAYKAKLKDLAK